MHQSVSTYCTTCHRGGNIACVFCGNQWRRKHCTNKRRKWSHLKLSGSECSCCVMSQRSETKKSLASTTVRPLPSSNLIIIAKPLPSEAFIDCFKVDEDVISFDVKNKPIKFIVML